MDNASPAQALRLGDILSRSLTVSIKLAVPCLAATGLANLPDAAADYAFNRYTLSEASHGHVKLAAMLIGTALLAFCEGFIARLGMDVLEGRTPRVAAAAGLAIQTFPAVLAMSLLYYVGLIVGTALLVVPGLIAVAAWSVVGPVCVLERPGPIASFRRSARLTKGHRWKLFGLFLLFLVAAFGSGLAIDAGRQLAGPDLALLIQVALDAVVYTFFAIMLVVAYDALRAAKEGQATHRLAAVFD